MPNTMITTTTTRTVRSGGPVTTTGTTRYQRIRMIPIWSIKLITAILSIIILILVMLQPYAMYQIHAWTFIVLILTCGFLLGWALPSVLNRFLSLHRTDTITYMLTAVLTVLSLILCVVYIINNDYYSRTEHYRLMIGITVCIGIEAIICLILISWILFGNYTIVENR